MDVPGLGAGSARVSRVGDGVLTVAHFSLSCANLEKACFCGTQKPTRETRALPLLPYSPESVDYFGTETLEFATMNRGQTREERSAALGYLHVHVASVSGGSLPGG